MINVPCEVCGRELTEPGGIILTPPLGQTVDKWHVCNNGDNGCFDLLRAKLQELSEERIKK